MLFDIEHLKGGRRLVALLFSIGVVHIVCYYLAGWLVAPLDLEEGVLPQPDVQLYLQAARRIVEGAPFSFTSGEPLCSGTTSVLYPFLLALPCMLGAPMRVMIEWGFWLNAAFYLTFLLCWCDVFARIFENTKRTGFLAIILLGLSGQPIFCALSQSDVGLWMAAISLFVWAILVRRQMLSVGLVLLAPWIRPEGALLPMALLLTLFLSRAMPVKFEFPRFVVGLVAFGCIGALGVFMLNYTLTGSWQFSSVANKGHFVLYPFAEAVHRTFVDLLTICRGLVCGQAFAFPRSHYLVPVVGPILFWSGILVHDWRHRSSAVLMAYLFASLGGILSVSISGWQGTNVDRYLAWVQPVLVLFEAEGAVFFAETLAKRACAAASVVLVLPLAFTGLSAGDFLICYHLSVADCRRLAVFSSEIGATLPAMASIGTVGHCGFAYDLADRRLAHLGGIYSPEFRARTLMGNLSLLKREPSLRFSHWLFSPEDRLYGILADRQGPVLLHGPDGLELREADWRPFDRATVASDWLAFGKRLVRYVDVGCDLDERDSSYEMSMRYGAKPFGVFCCFAELDGAPAFDTGRVICGGDALSVDLEPGKDAVVVMRMLSSARVAVPSRMGYSAWREFVFRDRIELDVSVDGVSAGRKEFVIKPNGFSDVSFVLSGNLLTSPRVRFDFSGDHIVCGYWFYQ